MIRDRFGAGIKARYIFRVCVFTHVYECVKVLVHMCIYTRKEKK